MTEKPASARRPYLINDSILKSARYSPISGSISVQTLANVATSVAALSGGKGWRRMANGWRDCRRAYSKYEISYYVFVSIVGNAKSGV